MVWSVYSSGAAERFWCDLKERLRLESCKDWLEYENSIIDENKLK
jgi:hypothetical protein